MEVADVTEGVRSDEGDTRNGRMKGGSETVDEQVEKKGGKNSALRNDSVDPVPPKRTWDRVPHRKFASAKETP